MEMIDALLAKEDFPEGKCWQTKSFSGNKEIVMQGDTSKTVFYLQQGAARVLGTVDVGENKHMRPGVYDLKPGEIFGELVLFDDEPRSASVVALEESIVILIDGDQLMNYLQKNNEIGFKLMRELMNLMVSRLRQANKKVFSLLAWGLKAHHIEEHLR